MKSVMTVMHAAELVKSERAKAVDFLKKIIKRIKISVQLKIHKSSKVGRCHRQSEDPVQKPMLIDNDEASFIDIENLENERREMAVGDN